jgi:hypothetical protein
MLLEAVIKFSTELYKYLYKFYLISDVEFHT